MPVIVAIIQVIKGAFPGMPSRFWPMVAVVVGVLWVSNVFAFPALFLCESLIS